MPLPPTSQDVNEIFADYIQLAIDEIESLPDAISQEITQESALRLRQVLIDSSQNSFSEEL